MSDRISAIKAFFKSLGANKDEIDEALKDEPPPAPPAEPPKPDETVTALKATVEKQQGAVTDLEKRLKAAEDETAALKAERRRATFVAKAAALKDLSGFKADDHAELLDKAEAALGAEAFGKLFDVLKASSAAIATSHLYAEYGSRGAPEPGSARAELVAKTADLRKADPDLTDAQAEDQILARDAALSRRVLAEEQAR